MHCWQLGTPWPHVRLYMDGYDCRHKFTERRKITSSNILISHLSLEYWYVNGDVETYASRQLDNINMHLLRTYNLTILQLVLDSQSSGDCMRALLRHALSWTRSVITIHNIRKFILKVIELKVKLCIKRSKSILSIAILTKTLIFKKYQTNTLL